MNHKTKLSVLFLKEGNAWVGQCLEHDLAAQGTTMSEAKTSLSHTIAAQMFLDTQNGVEPLSKIKPAPAYYRSKFENAERLKYTIELAPQYQAEVDDARVALV